MLNPKYKRNDIVVLKRKWEGSESDDIEFIHDMNILLGQKAKIIAIELEETYDFVYYKCVPLRKDLEPKISYWREDSIFLAKNRCKHLQNK